MKRKNQFSTSNKYWLLILVIICIVLMGLSGFAESGKGPAFLGSRLHDRADAERNQPCRDVDRRCF